MLSQKTLYRISKHSEFLKLSGGYSNMYSSVSTISRNKPTERDKSMIDCRKSIETDDCYNSELDAIYNLKLRTDENAHSLRTLQYVAYTNEFKSLNALQQHKMYAHRPRKIKILVIHTRMCTKITL